MYAQHFTSGTRPKPQDIITLYPEGKTDWPAPCFGNQLSDSDAHYLAGPDASILCHIAAQLPVSTLAEAMPLYIRPPDAVVGAQPAWLTAH